MSPVTMPPEPGASARSIAITLLAPASAARTASNGNGRNEMIPSTPIFIPCPSRSSSTTSLIVPCTEPSAITTVSASSSR